MMCNSHTETSLGCPCVDAIINVCIVLSHDIIKLGWVCQLHNIADM